MILFSKSTGWFYRTDIHGDAIPADAVEVSADDHAMLLAGQAAGGSIVAGGDGRPALRARGLAEEVGFVLDRINAWRDEQEQALIVFDHGGRQWDGGLVVRQRLQPVIALAALPEGFYWTAADNVDVPMTLAELRDLNAAHEAAIVTRGWQIHARQRAMKTEVAALETVESVRAYVVGWPD